jgi:hypothetical protein
MQLQQYHDDGIGLLHRRPTSSEREVIVHETRSERVEVCKMGSLDSLDESRLVAHSLVLSRNGCFRALEYGNCGLT